MSFFKMRADKADTLFSRFIRLRDKACKRCGRRGEGAEGISGLHCSHFHSRRKEGTRFDEKNCDTLCFSCHQAWEHEKIDRTGSLRDYGTWKLAQLGKFEFDLLMLRANTYAKKDRKLSLLIVKQLMKTLPAEKVMGEKA